MFWFCGILAGLLVSAADIFLLTRERKASVCIHAVLRDTVLTVLSALAVMQYGLKIVGLFHTELHGALYPLKFFALVLGHVICPSAYVTPKELEPHPAFSTTFCPSSFL